MIYFIKTKQNSAGLVCFIIKIDAAAAKIENRDKKQYIESGLNIRIIRLSYEIREGLGAKSEDDLRDFLRNELFTHYVDMNIIENFITNVKNQCVKYANDITEIGLDVLYEYENHPWKDEDEEERKRWRKWDDQK